MTTSTASGRKFRFGTCLLDFDTRQLFVNGRETHITPKAFEFLSVLTEHAPRALTKSELIEHLWPDTYVSEDALARLVADVRTVLGENARLPKWIRTVHGYGYAFVVDAPDERVKPQQRACSLTWGSREFRLKEGDNVIGRDPEVQILVNSELVSRRHARILLTPDDARVEDLGSKNGTSVSGKRVKESRRLADGDVITIGEFEFRFHMTTDMATLTASKSR